MFGIRETIKEGRMYTRSTNRRFGGSMWFSSSMRFPIVCMVFTRNAGTSLSTHTNKGELEKSTARTEFNVFLAKRPNTTCVSSIATLSNMGQAPSRFHKPWNEKKKTYECDVLESVECGIVLPVYDHERQRIYRSVPINTRTCESELAPKECNVG